MELAGPDHHQKQLSSLPSIAAKSGCSVCEGPQHSLHPSWFLSVSGAEYVTLYLWLGKDWSWSQLRWTTTAFIFGTLAIIWLSGMIYSAWRSRLYSEAYLGSGLLFWLLANFVWMAGEFRSLWYSSADADDDYDYEEQGRTVARYLLAIAVIMFVIFFAVLVPLDVFAKDRQSPTMRRLEAMSPPCPKHLVGFFTEFRIFASLHFASWSVKDCLWAWDQPLAYGVAFLFTILLNVDLLWRLGTHSQLYIDFVHCSILLLWVIANGTWAIGEMMNEVGLTEEQYRLYRFDLTNPAMISDSAFQMRYATGWVFFIAVSFLVIFYIHWAVMTTRKRVPSYEDFSKRVVIACDDGDGRLIIPSDGAFAGDT